MEATALKQAEPETHLIHLQREMDEELRHIFLGSVLKRIRIFAETWDSDANSIVISRAVEKDFVKDKDQEFMIIIAVREMQIVGHLLARALDYYGNLYINVHQMDIDANSGITLEQEQRPLRWLINWQKEIGAKGIRAMVPDAVNARRLKIMYGFTEMYIMMKLENYNG